MTARSNAVGTSVIPGHTESATATDHVAGERVGSFGRIACRKNAFGE